MSEGFNATGVRWNAGGHTGMVEFNGGDRNLLVMFYNRSVQNAAKSLAAGRPIHEDRIYIKIQQPGEMLNVIDRPVTDEDKQRFRGQWSNFVHDRTQAPEGTSIDQLFPNHPSVAENLRAYGVFTVEQCAELSAHAIDTIGRGAQEYQNKAKKYLDSANKGANFHILQKENEDLRQNMKIQENQIAQLRAQLDAFASKLVDPVRASLSPPFIPGHDAQTERINNNAPTKEVAQKASRGRKPKTVEDQITDPFASNLPNNNIDIMMTEGQDQ